MGTSATRDDLIEVLAGSFDTSKEIITRYVRDLTSGGLLPAGKPGRKSSLPPMTSGYAAVLATAVLASDSARASVAAAKKLLKMEGPEVVRDFEGAQLTIGAYRGGFVEAVEALINLARAPDLALSYRSFDYALGVTTAQGHSWAEILLQSGADKNRFQRTIFIDPLVPVEVLSSAYCREARISNSVVQEVAACLGAYSFVEWAAIEPRFDRPAKATAVRGEKTND